jgi:hypothetical protein
MNIIDTKKAEGLLAVLEKSHVLLDRDNIDDSVTDFSQPNTVKIKDKILRLAVNNFSL